MKTARWWLIAHATLEQWNSFHRKLFVILVLVQME